MPFNRSQEHYVNFSLKSNAQLKSILFLFSLSLLWLKEFWIATYILIIGLGISVLGKYTSARPSGGTRGYFGFSPYTHAYKGESNRQ